MALPGGALTDGSGTITAGGTSQEVFEQKPDRQYLLIQNVGDDDLWVNFDIDAVESQPSILLASGAALEFSAAGTGIVPTASVNIIGATTDQPFTAKEF